MRQYGTLLKIAQTRVWRTYNGGKRIDEWHGKTDGQNGHFPEDWIASTIAAHNPGRNHIREGLSRVLNLEGEPFLAEVIAENPALLLGKTHVEQFDLQPGVLVKLLDAAERLCIQVHPDLMYAKNVFNSSYGKTEAWYVLDDSPFNGKKPCIYFGFKPYVTRELWKRLFEEQDISQMLDCLHKIEVVKGDVFFIAGGVPHAIGEGCFVIEIQEPTDYTMRTELVTPAGLAVHPDHCHQGAGFEKMLDCFHYEPHTLEETLSLWKVPPVVTENTTEHTVTSLLDNRYTNLFSMRKLNVRGTYERPEQNAFSILLVLSGSGVLKCGETNYPVSSGDYWFVPASSGAVTCCADSGGLNLIECLPPSFGM